MDFGSGPEDVAKQDLVVDYIGFQNSGNTGNQDGLDAYRRYKNFSELVLCNFKSHRHFPRTLSPAFPCAFLAPVVVVYK